ncbi:hypothetical protein QR680_005806 [Steinernema hermaphroditum]|uniref:Uncharacterized protein n=1 Tax=Steinernema hermaphroditum TaxID=289476 RepID=A0AA39HUH1_9BILA|nr:hypothetical protein QR680_005806 [Steinernema hermaphroditum]
MSALRTPLFGQSSSVLLQRRPQHFALMEERQKEEEFRRRIALQREKERVAFEKERLVLLDERRHLKRRFPAESASADPREAYLRELRRERMRQSMHALKSNGLKTSGNGSLDDDRLLRVHQLTEADLFDDDSKRERAIQEAKNETRRRVLMQIRSTLPKGSKISDEELMRAYEAGKFNRKQQHQAPSSSAPRRLQAPAAPKKAAREAETQHMAVSTSDEGASTKNVVIEFNGSQYELAGVPRERDGQMIQIEANHYEPNLVYYFYDDETFRSAIYLPSRTEKPKPLAADRKKPLRLRSDVEPSECQNPNVSHDSGLSSMGEPEEECAPKKRTTAIELIRLLHKTGVH